MTERWFDYRDRSISFEFQERKWEFAGRYYKRRGQAIKAAWKEWRKTQ